MISTVAGSSVGRATSVTLSQIAPDYHSGGILVSMGVTSLYEKYHASRQDERLGLFESVCAEFAINRGLYPGCFVHVTPSFVIPEMYYVDADGNANKFFADGVARELVERNRVYDDSPFLQFHFQDYQRPIPIDDGHVGLLISQYAGFVSENCKRYLSQGGYLIANNSHGDAGLASCDPEFRLVAVVNRRGERWSLGTGNLSDYFIPKSRTVPQEPSDLADHIRDLGKGIGYTKTASDYVFKKV